jgi:hypothetical protein|nr:MAG TPA: hypothetical protein [Caudoviricetes sp.]
MKGLSPGDLVLLKKVSPKEYKVWPTIVDYMEPFLGLVVTVAKSRLGDPDTTFRIMEDKRRFLWSYWMIEKRISNDEIICWTEGRH